MTLSEPDAILQHIADAVDPRAAVPVPVQLRGVLEYGIATGVIEPGARLPTVRAMAARLGLSPVTVNGVVGRLREAGQVQTRPGSGSIVAENGGAALADRQALHAGVEALLRQAAAVGIGPAQLAGMIAARSAGGSGGVLSRPLRLVVLGTFPTATAAYADDLRALLPRGDSVEAMTREGLAPEALRGADLVLVPRNLVAELREQLAPVPVAGLALIPNEATRIGLARIAPEARVLLVSFYPAFVPSMLTGLRDFAPHIRPAAALAASDPGLAAALAAADVVVHSTGAEAAAAARPPSAQALEYRHTPDARAVAEEVLPALDALRTLPPLTAEDGDAA